MIKKWVVVFIKVADSRLAVTLTPYTGIEVLSISFGIPFFCTNILDELEFIQIFFVVTLSIQVAFLL
jgi:hypothetical protein